MLENKIIKILKKREMPYVIYALIMSFFFLKFYYVFMDDRVLFSTHHELLLYNVFSSRVLINPPIWVMSYCPIWLWGILTICILTFIFRGINDLVFDIYDIRHTYILLMILLTIPLSVMTDVGWVITSMTYVWPLGAAVGTLYTIKKHRYNIKLPWYALVGYTLLALYASNKEELCIPMLFIFVSLIIKNIKEKRRYVVFWLQAFVTLINLVWHAMSPNNDYRYSTMSAECDGFIDKLEIGISSTMQWLFLKFNFTFLVFSVMLAIVVFERYKDVLYRIVCTIPVFVWITSACYGMYLCDGVFDINALNIASLGYGLSISRGKYSCLSTRVEAVVLIVVAVSVAWMVAIVLDDKKDLFIAYLLIFGTACGRITVGFANGGWGNFARTYLYMYYAFFIVLGLIFKANIGGLKRDDRKVNNIVFSMICFAFLGIMVNLCTL